MKKIILLFTVVFLGFLIRPATASANSNTNRDGFVRVLHASPDAPSVDVYVNGNKALTNVPFGANSDYIPLQKGEYNIKVTPTGATTPVVIDQNIDVRRGKYYTVAATGRLANIEATALRDRNRLPVKDSVARVRFVRLSPDAPAVDITTADGKVLFGHVNYTQRNKYERIPEGTYNLQVRLAGTNTVVLNLPNVVIEGGKSYSVFALGLAGGIPGLSAKIVVDRQ